MSESQFLRSITVLPVRDIAEAGAWYKSVLGFDTIYVHEDPDDADPDNYAVLRHNNLEVHLILDEPPPHALPWTKAGAGYLYLIVRDVNAVFADLQSRGVKITRNLQTENWGARGFNLTDPSGNSIHIEQHR